eukprot:m.973598 g.973598  ORF g.973598 m.973598 type:complete len:132 (-) comp23935_c3_seq6:2008-2403(-)
MNVRMPALVPHMMQSVWQANGTSPSVEASLRQQELDFQLMLQAIACHSKDIPIIGEKHTSRNNSDDLDSSSMTGEDDDDDSQYTGYQSDLHEESIEGQETIEEDDAVETPSQLDEEEHLGGGAETNNWTFF